jgi:hypothetical protein
MIGTYDRDFTVRRRTNALWAVFLVFGAMYIGREISRGGPMLRVLAAVVVMGALAVPAIERPRTAVLSLFILLPFLGEIRHAFLSATGVAKLDPLLLVTSAVAITIFVSLTLNKEMDFGGTPMAKVVFLLLVVGLLQVFNPGQGSGASALLVGLTGVMINLIPISFFFIARSIADDEMTNKVMRLVLIMGSLSAAYGLVQVFVGFRGFEKAFLARAGYNAATVGNTTRPFSFFNNSAEFAAYSHYAFVIALGIFLFTPKGKRFRIAAVMVLIVYGGFATGSRGFTVKCALAAVLALGARTRHRALAAGIAVFALTGYIFWANTTSSTTTIQSKKAGISQLVEQQLRALRDPLDRNKSTLPVHAEAATRGLKDAVVHAPFGLGTGRTTRGGTKFQGGSASAGTELDISDAFLSLGIPGGVLYLLAIVIGITQASRVRRKRAGPASIAIWVAAVSSIGAWLIGGLYSVTPLIWFFLGAADGAYKRMRDEVPGEPVAG